MSIIEIKGTDEIEVKRLYMPVSVDIKCPHCQVENNHDFNFSQDYSSYPCLNTMEEIHAYCDSCDNEFSFKAALKMSLDIDYSTTKGE